NASPVQRGPVDKRGKPCSHRVSLTRRAPGPRDPETIDPTEASLVTHIVYLRTLLSEAVDVRPASVVASGVQALFPTDVGPPQRGKLGAVVVSYVLLSRVGVIRRADGDHVTVGGRIRVNRLRSGHRLHGL